ncbi:MAG: glycosyltransferase family 4 protein [Flavobacteriales bacterium]
MRILFLADINSSHTKRWAEGLVRCGLSIGIFSFSVPRTHWFEAHGIVCYHPTKALAKWLYIFQLRALKNAMRSFKPDLLHAHYASGYGLLGRLSRFQPFIVSAWGSDVMSFPAKSRWHAQLIGSNLKHAKAVTVTSHVLHEEVNRRWNISSSIIPFGIDAQQFAYHERPYDRCTFGIIKGLEPIYGVDVLIKAFSKLRMEDPRLTCKIIIVGDGSERLNLEKLARAICPPDSYQFVGRADYADVPKYLQEIDVFVNPSLNESFGVAVLEASSTGCAVIASRVGGLPEVVQDETTGLLCKPDDTSALTECMSRLIMHPEIRHRMGLAGAQFVRKEYDWDRCLQHMIDLYREMKK